MGAPIFANTKDKYLGILPASTTVREKYNTACNGTLGDSLIYRPYEPASSASLRCVNALHCASPPAHDCTTDQRRCYDGTIILQEYSITLSSRPDGPRELMQRKTHAAPCHDTPMPVFSMVPSRLPALPPDFRPCFNVLS